MISEAIKSAWNCISAFIWMVSPWGIVWHIALAEVLMKFTKFTHLTNFTNLTNFTKFTNLRVVVQYMIALYEMSAYRRVPSWQI